MRRALRLALALAARCQAVDFEATSDPPSAKETYASILYAPSARDSSMRKAWARKRLELLCIVAAQGLQLHGLDPARDRSLLINSELSADAEACALLDAATWSRRVVDFGHHPDPTGGNRTFAFPYWERLDPAAAVAVGRGRLVDKRAIDSAEALGRKNWLWDLPYERAFFVDADMLFLNTSKLRTTLRKLWRTRRDGTVLAPPLRAYKDCFSSALLMLAPNPADFKALNDYLWDPDPSSLAHCPTHDQRVLNSVFAKRWTKMEFRKFGGHSKGKVEATAIHFHNKRPSPYVMRLFQGLIAQAPPAVQQQCGALYKPHEPS